VLNQGLDGEEERLRYVNREAGERGGDHGKDALVQTKATKSSDFGVAKTGSDASREEGKRRRTSPGS
jgi:hypothetical protein